MDGITKASGFQRCREAGALLALNACSPSKVSFGGTTAGGFRAYLRTGSRAIFDMVLPFHLIIAPPLSGCFLLCLHFLGNITTQENLPPLFGCYLSGLGQAQIRGLALVRNALKQPQRVLNSTLDRR